MLQNYYGQLPDDGNYSTNCREMTNPFLNFASVMATSIKLIRKYVWLAETVRRSRRITIDEINRLWSRNSTLNHDGESEIPERTFHRHRQAIADIFGIDIVCDRRSGNEYYIENPEVLEENSFTANLFSRLAVDNRLLDNQDLAARVIDEPNAAGMSYIPLVLDALQLQVKISIEYRSQFSGKTRRHVIEPQFLKKNKQLWYVVSRLESGAIIPLALDRVLWAELSADRFEFDPEIEPSTYFSDVVGVNLDPDYSLERVLVKVTAPQRNYLDNLPLHHTQKAVETAEEYTIYEYRLCPEYEFQHELMRMGESIEVLEPSWLRHQIKTFAEKILSSHQ